MGFQPQRAYWNINWERWFAWHPVKLHGRYTWLTIVYRQEQASPYYVMPYYRYGTIFDVL